MSAPLTAADARFTSFLNAPVHTNLETLQTQVAVLGVPYGPPNNMNSLTRFSSTPAAIRQATQKFGYGRFIESWDYDLGGPLLNEKDISIVDCGDVRADPFDIPGNDSRIREATSAILDANGLPVLLGGACAIMIPMLEAYEGRRPVTLVQVDAHIDWLDRLDGVKRNGSGPMRRASEMSWVEGIVQLGMRGVGTAQRSDVEDALAYGAQIFTADQIYDEGPRAILDQIPDDRDYIIHIDCDGLDPSEVPAVAAPAPGGPTYRQISKILMGIAGKGRIVGVQIGAFDAERDVNGLTALVAARLILNVIGTVARNGQLDG